MTSRTGCLSRCGAATSAWGLSSGAVGAFVSERKTVLQASIERAVLALAAADVEAGRDPDRPASAREKLRVMVKATHVGSRVTALIVLWAIALEDLGRESIGVEEYVAWASESRSTTHRRLREYRELFPGSETPNEVALLVLRAAGEARPTAQTLIPA